MHEKFHCQPGWSTPVAIDYDKPSFFAWFLGIVKERDYCRAHRQGRCPGLDQCHDCNWSRQRAPR